MWEAAVGDARDGAGAPDHDVGAPDPGAGTRYRGAGAPNHEVGADPGAGTRYRGTRAPDHDTDAPAQPVGDGATGVVDGTWDASVCGDGDRPGRTFSLGDGFDVAGYIVRARRAADLSQRELAGVLGVAQSTVSRMESRGLAGVQVFVRLLEACGLHLSVVDDAGQPVPPVPRDVVRDNAGRRFPAHLDVAPPDEVPWERRAFPRYDRRPARGWYHLRPRRDAIRARRGAVPFDHPTVGALARREEERAVRERRRRLLTAAAAERLNPTASWLDERRHGRRGWRHRAKRRWRERENDDAP